MERPKDMKVRRSKKHYYILCNGRPVGESWAVSPEKAITNWWWREEKNSSEFTPRSSDPQDYDAVEVM